MSCLVMVGSYRHVFLRMWLMVMRYLGSNVVLIIC